MGKSETAWGVDVVRKVIVVAFPQAKLLDVTGPCEVFADANQALGKKSPAYDIELVSNHEGPVETSSGVSLIAHRGFATVRGSIDTLLVVGGPGVTRAVEDAALLRWIVRSAAQARRVGAVCTGAFLLAAAGLLDGRRAVTHWAHCDSFARQYPKVTVDPDAIYVRDGDVYTSAGVTAGMDLALSLVEADLGRNISLTVARNLVLFVRRPGGQSQFSTLLELQAADRSPLRDLQSWAAEHLADDLSVEVLAARVHMSVRNFSRIFRRDVGRTPAEFVERVRVEAARRRLEEVGGGLRQIALECGLGSPDSMRRSFLRVLRVAPSDYRARFHAN
jgi:transcriptional regulator GlxA family with amidase domain